jgi:lipoate-protein ligase A
MRNPHPTPISIGLTYSVSLSDRHPLAAGSIVESYRRLSAALLGALHTLGLGAHADKRAERAGVTGPICFEVPSDYEITANGKKLIGSAQVRRQNAVLQHGAFPLTGDVGRICEALAFRDEAARDRARALVYERATTFAAAAGFAVSWDEAADAIANAFARRFSLEFELSSLTPSERSRAEELARTRYGSPEWTLKIAAPAGNP